MFTGIITDVGVVRSCEGNEQKRRFVIGTHYDAASITIGASIAHDGCCLTVVEKGTDEAGHYYTLDISSHTLEHTTLGSWDVGRRTNLERALKTGDELGGHMVSGHVDGVALIDGVDVADGATHFTLSAPKHCAPFIADKGSVTLDGTSLTVTWVNGDQFGLTLIPHTLEVTTWGERKVGDALNLEVDMLARYLKRFAEYGAYGIEDATEKRQ